MEDCAYFEIIDWDEDTDEILYAVCGLPSPCWPNCKNCSNYHKLSNLEEKE
jgi:hypothetical protein